MRAAFPVMPGPMYTRLRRLRPAESGAPIRYAKNYHQEE